MEDNSTLIEGMYHAGPRREPGCDGEGIVIGVKGGGRWVCTCRKDSHDIAG